MRRLCPGQGHRVGPNNLVAVAGDVGFGGPDSEELCCSDLLSLDVVEDVRNEVCELILQVRAGLVLHENLHAPSSSAADHFFAWFTARGDSGGTVNEVRLIRRRRRAFSFIYRLCT